MMNASQARRRALVGALTAVVAGVVPHLALAQAPESRQVAKLAFAEQQPGVPSALDFEIDYRDPDDPEGKPPSVSKVVTRLASGARWKSVV